MIESLKFKSKSKHLMTYKEFVRKKEVAMLCHQLELNCYHGKKKDVEVFRLALESMVLQSDCGKDGEFNNYLKKGY